MNFRQLFENKTPITDYDIWRDKVDAQGAEKHMQKNQTLIVAQSWSGDTIGEFNLRTGQGWITPGQSINEFDAGEGGFGPFKLYAGDAHKYHHVDTFNSLDAAIEEVEFLIDTDSNLITNYWKIVDGTGEQVWDQDPDTMYDKMRSAGKMQFKKPDNKGVAEGSKKTKPNKPMTWQQAYAHNDGESFDARQKRITQYEKSKGEKKPKHVDWDKKGGMREGVAEGSGKNVVKSVKVGNFRHDLVDTGMGWQVRIYNGDELYDTGLSKNSEQKGLAALEDAIAYTEKQTNTKRQGVAEGDDGYGYKSLSTEQIMKLIQSGNWEAVQDVVPGKHIQLRNNRNGKNTTVHVKQDVAEGFDELDAYIKAKQAPKPSGGAGIKRGSYGMPGRKITKGIPGARPGGGSTGHTTPGNRDFGRPHSIPRATPRGIDDYDANYRREVDEGEYKDTVNKSKIPAVQRKAQGGDWKVSTKDLEHERSKSPTGAAGLAKAKQRLDMNENLQQLPPNVIDLIKKVAQSDAAPEHKAAIIKSIMAKYQPVKDIAEEPKQTAREKFNQGLKRAGFDPDAAAKRLTDLIAKQKAEREKFEKENPAVYGDDKEVKEEKVRLDPKCWTGKKIGNPKTKVKGGVRVNNCVPK